MGIFEDAKKAVTLEEFLPSHGIVLRQIGQSARAQVCPSTPCNTKSPAGADKYKLSVKGVFWRCWSCGLSGDVIRAASIIWACSQADAAQRLLKVAAAGRTGVVLKSAVEGTDVRQHEAVELVVNVLFRRVGCSDDVRLALNKRGITDEVIDMAVSQGVLIGLSGHPGEAKAQLEKICGKTLLVHAGMLQESAAAAPIAFRPLLLRFGGGVEARRILSTSGAVIGPKLLHYGGAAQPFILKGGADGHVITKSPVDALSLATLGFGGTIHAMAGDSAWRKVRAAGTAKPAWANAIDGPVQVAFTGCDDGRSKAQELVDMLNGAGFGGKASLYPLPASGDLNDLLRTFIV